MNPLFLSLSFVLVIAQFTVSRRYVFAPLLIATFLLPNQAVEIGGFGFPACRLLIVAGLIRAVGTRSFVWSIRNPLDALVLCWSGVIIFSAFFHHPQNENPFIARISWTYEIAGTYLFGRAYVRTIADLIRACKCLAMVVIPLAVLMLIEAATGRNVYAALGAAVQGLAVREGRVRASGPFGGSILAGSAGGTAAPLILALFWSRGRRLAIMGIASCVIIAYCSASSGPVVALLAGLGAAFLWRWRSSIGRIRTGIILLLLGLHIIMKAPVWYLMARIDFTGGSSSWGRAELITQALNHANEWWRIGTDYTRHWMPYGIEWSAAHTDITNYYIKMGILGGLPLMLTFILILFKAFQLLGRKIVELRATQDDTEFLVWCAGSALFAHAVTFFSVSYYDQSYVPLFLLIGAVPGVCSIARRDHVATTTCDSAALWTAQHENRRHTEIIFS